MSWADCCGCGKKSGEEVLSGSGDKIEGSPFEATAKTWADIYVPQNNEATMNKLAEAGGTESLIRQYGSNATTGIPGTAEDLRGRIMQWGENRYPEPPFESWWALFFECFKDIILLILIAAAIVSLVVGIIEHGPQTGWIDGVAILIAVVIVATVTASNDYNKQLQFRKLSKESASMVEIRVIRGGKEVAVKVAEIVAGDIIMVDTGCKLPADGLLIRGTDMKCNESALTGESDEVAKDPINHPFLLAGTNVTSGTGSYLATAVGVRSLQGQIMKDTATEAEDTPLQQKLDGLATKIGYVGMVAALATFIAMMIIKATGGGTSQSATWASWTIAAFIYAITIVVVAIPEGLPLAVTISLAYSTGKMLQDKNLIRHLDACETMGNATDICTDKTGTLTENQMTVVESWLAGKNYVFSTSLQNITVTDPATLPPALRDLLRDQLALNSTAAIVYKEENGMRKEEVKGSKTEGAGIKLVNGMMASSGGDYQSIRDTYTREFRVIKQFAFSSERKMMSTIVELPDGRVRVYTTGGSDMVLSRCISQSLLTADGSTFNNTPLTEADVTEIIRGVIEPMARQSLRTIAIAYRDFPNRAMLPRAVEELPEQELRLYGILGIKDPLRKGVTEAVDIAAQAGVRVRMVTGDNKITASAIAKECHILRNETDLVMEGPVFRTMTPAQLDMILPRLAVLARSSPKDKMILVRRLNGNLPSNEKEWKEDHPDGDWETQRDILLPGYYDEWKRARQHVSGNVARGVVGVTGDGTNDAPALKASDVGLAMGIAGTEVAKEACDIIITDDNFASIVNSILWGRSVYDNVRSFLQFQLTVNIVALLLTFIAAVMQEDPPLNPVMMLWVNLIMDTMGALALATQTPSKELLQRKPFAASAFLVSPKMWRHLAVQSLFQLITLLVLLKVGPSSFGITIDYLQVNNYWISNKGATSDDVTYYTNSFIFNTFVFSQIWNEFNARSLDDRWNIFRGLGSDLTFIAIIIISGGVQALLVQYGGNFVHTTGLSGIHWLYSILISLITFPLGIVMRLIPVNDKPSDYAEFYTTFFAKQMEIQLEQHRDSHPAFAKGGKGSSGGAGGLPHLDTTAHVHGLPVPAGAGIEMTGATPAKDASKRNLGSAPVGVSIRSSASDGPIAAPLSPTNELGMIQGLSTSGLNAASPTGDHGFSSNKFASSSSSSAAVTGSSGNNSAAPTGASTATPSLVELQGVTVDSSSGATSGAGAFPAAGSSSVPQPPSPAMSASAPLL